MGKIKCVFALFVFMCMSFSAMGQNNNLKSFTENPRVDKQQKSIYGSEKITKVYLATDATLVLFEYNVSDKSYNSWVSMSSGTILKSKSSSKKYKIRNWGYIDSDGNCKSLNFNEKYDVERGGKYLFYMGFDAIDKPTNNISIYENGYKGVYWEGIHLNRYGSYGEENTSNQKEIARFIVTSAKENGRDITPQIANSGLYTVFYSVGDVTYMANYMSNRDSQSWGEIYNVSSNTTKETPGSYKADEIRFSWSYQNSYDSKSGTCQCSLVKIYKPQGIVSILKMVTESLDVIEYTGYMEGSLDFSNF